MKKGLIIKFANDKYCINYKNKILRREAIKELLTVKKGFRYKNDKDRKCKAKQIRMCVCMYIKRENLL